ncbi:MAG: hypothetical protein KDC67_03095 [Ignavibacteriae bacterium]|nr:hypothetical protein [Ignavibacteriota bacterium]
MQPQQLVSQIINHYKSSLSETETILVYGEILENWKYPLSIESNALDELEEFELAHQIMKICCLVYGETEFAVSSKSREQNLVKTRQCYCAFAKLYTSLSLKKIGSLLKGDSPRKTKDHSTVINSIKRHNELMSKEKYGDEYYQNKAEMINDKIKKHIQVLQILKQTKTTTK